MSAKQKCIADDIARLWRSADAPFFDENAKCGVTEWSGTDIQHRAAERKCIADVLARLGRGSDAPFFDENAKGCVVEWNGMAVSILDCSGMGRWPSPPWRPSSGGT